MHRNNQNHTKTHPLVPLQLSFYLKFATCILNRNYDDRTFWETFGTVLNKYLYTVFSWRSLEIWNQQNRNLSPLRMKIRMKGSWKLNCKPFRKNNPLKSVRKLENVANEEIPTSRCRTVLTHQRRRPPPPRAGMLSLSWSRTSCPCILLAGSATAGTPACTAAASATSSFALINKKFFVKDSLVRGMDPDPDPALEPDPDPCITMQK